MTINYRIDWILIPEPVQHALHELQRAVKANTDWMGTQITIDKELEIFVDVCVPKPEK